MNYIKKIKASVTKKAIIAFSKELRKKAYDDDYDDYVDDGLDDYIQDQVESILASLEAGQEPNFSGIAKDNIQHVLDGALNGLSNIISISDRTAYDAEYSRLSGILEAAASGTKAARNQEDSEQAEAEQNSWVTVNLFYGTVKTRAWRDGGEGGRDSKFIPDEFVTSQGCQKKDAGEVLRNLVERAKQESGLVDEGETFQSDSETYFGESGGQGGINENYKTFSYTITAQEDKSYHEQ